MTILESTKESFIALRSEGKTFEQIASELKVSLRTLTDWAKELKTEIENLRAFRLEVLQDKYHILKEKRIELFGQNLQAVIDELSHRKLDSVPTAKLFDLVVKYGSALRKDEVPITFKDPAESNMLDLNKADPRQILDACNKRIANRLLARQEVL